MFGFGAERVGGARTGACLTGALPGGGGGTKVGALGLRRRPLLPVVAVALVGILPIAGGGGGGAFAGGGGGGGCCGGSCDAAGV